MKYYTITNWTDERWGQPHMMDHYLARRVSRFLMNLETAMWLMNIPDCWPGQYLQQMTLDLRP